jgi:RNA polymerase sigma-70 factor, ECF subfamily
LSEAIPSALLQESVARARQTWPELAPRGDAFEDALAHAIAGADDRVAALRKLDVAELWLAVACAAGDRTALASFERRYVAPLRRILRSMQIPDASIDDIEQQLRMKLLTTGDDGRCKLLDYAGQGKLAGLVKVVALRTALDGLRRKHEHPGGDEDQRTADALMDHQLGPELEAVRLQHRDEVRSAFADAAAELDDRDRSILRLHLLERLSIDGLAALYGVHRGTAARRLVRVRDRLATRTRELLRERLALDDRGLESLFRAVDSQLDLSLVRVLA